MSLNSDNKLHLTSAFRDFLPFLLLAEFPLTPDESKSPKGVLEKLDSDLFGELKKFGDKFVENNLKLLDADYVDEKKYLFDFAAPKTKWNPGVIYPCINKELRDDGGYLCDASSDRNKILEKHYIISPDKKDEICNILETIVALNNSVNTILNAQIHKIKKG